MKHVAKATIGIALSIFATTVQAEVIPFHQANRFFTPGECIAYHAIERRMAPPTNLTPMQAVIAAFEATPARTYDSFTDGDVFWAGAGSGAFGCRLVSSDYWPPGANLASTMWLEYLRRVEARQPNRR